jgi:hypothetical protein
MNNMKMNQLRLAMTIVGLLALAGPAQADITYTVDEVMGAGGIFGTITTDGTIGQLGASDILGWNLNVDGNGGVTYNLNSINALSGVEVGNNTQVFNPNAGTPDLTATAQHIFFNFSGTDGGYLGFQTFPFYGGEHYASFGATDQADTYQGLAAVPESYNVASSIVVPESGTQIIASVATGNSVPDQGATTMTLFAAALLVLSGVDGIMRKRQSA